MFHIIQGQDPLPAKVFDVAFERSVAAAPRYGYHATGTGTGARRSYRNTTVDAAHAAAAVCSVDELVLR